MRVLQVSELTPDGRVQFDDGNGTTELDVADVHDLRDKALHSDDAGVRVDDRWIDADQLVSLAKFVDQLDRCSNCHDNPGTQDMGDGRRFCPGCSSAAAGSRYDDRLEG